MAISVAIDDLGSIGDQSIKRYTITNANGYSAAFIEYGARWTSMMTPDRLDRFEDVVLGFDDIAGYADDNHLFGATGGRYAGRIFPACITLDGKKYPLDDNDGGGILHGGSAGFHNRVWQSEPLTDGVRFTLVSAAGEAGFPGELKTTVDYRLNAANEVTMEVTAVLSGSGSTVVNICNHAYFNLAGLSEENIHEHEIAMHSHQVAVPAGKHYGCPEALSDVADSSFYDLRVLGKHLSREQLKDDELNDGLGYDCSWYLGDGKELQRAASLVHRDSGRQLDVFTTQPAVHLYSAGFLHNKMIGRGGRIYDRAAGLCLETQSVPNTPNAEAFPSAILRTGEEYHHRTVFRFGLCE